HLSVEQQRLAMLVRWQCEILLNGQPLFFRPSRFDHGRHVASSFVHSMTGSAFKHRGPWHRQNVCVTALGVAVLLAVGVVLAAGLDEGMFALAGVISKSPLRILFLAPRFLGRPRRGLFILLLLFRGRRRGPWLGPCPVPARDGRRSTAMFLVSHGV